MKNLCSILLLSLSAFCAVSGTAGSIGRSHAHKEYKERARLNKQQFEYNYQQAADAIKAYNYDLFSSIIQQYPTVLNPDEIERDPQKPDLLLLALKGLSEPGANRDQFLYDILPHRRIIDDSILCEFRELLKKSCEPTCDDATFKQQFAYIKTFIELAKDTAVYCSDGAPNSHLIPTTLQLYLTKYMNQNYPDSYYFGDDGNKIKHKRFKQLLNIANYDSTGNPQGPVLPNKTQKKFNRAVKALARHKTQRFGKTIKQIDWQQHPNYWNHLLHLSLQKLHELELKENSEPFVRRLLQENIPIQRENMIYTISQAWALWREGGTSPVFKQHIAALTTFVQLIKEGCSLDQNLNDSVRLRHPQHKDEPTPKDKLTPHEWLKHFALDTLSLLNLRLCNASSQYNEIWAEWSKALQLDTSDPLIYSNYRDLQTFDIRRSAGKNLHLETQHAQPSSSSAAACSSNQN